MRGLAKADVIALCVLLGLVIAAVPTVFGQVVNKQRELNKRSVCAANLRGMMQSIVVYAADNDDRFPAYTPTSSTSYDPTLKADEGAATGEETLRIKDNKYAKNTSAMLWMLALTEQVALKVFVCPSDPFADVVDNEAAATAPAAATGERGPRSVFTIKSAADLKKGDKYYRNFQSPKNISYSSAFPFGEDAEKKPTINGIWRNTVDASLPILSDMAPYLGKDQPATRPAGGDEKAAITPEQAKKINAQNHQFDGQNIAYADAHVEFQRSPAAGESNDNIWTLWKNDKMEGGDVIVDTNTLPHAPSGTQGSSDVIMVPVRDAKGNVK